MARLEDLATGLHASKSVQRVGEQAPEVISPDSEGQLGDQLLCRHGEPSLELVGMGCSRSFDGDNDLLCPVLEGNRINRVSIAPRDHANLEDNRI